jgi:hypothetical protein
MKNRTFAASSATVISTAAAVGILLLPIFLLAQAPPPPDAPEVVDYQKLIPVFPEAPSGWTADKPEGQTTEALTNVHRDYKKGEGDNVPIASISIIDSVANPESITTATDAWKTNSQTSEGYTKPVTIDGNPGSESYEKEQKHAALRLLVAKRYLLAIELQNQDPKELQEWVKRIDLKKLAEIK